MTVRGFTLNGDWSGQTTYANALEDLSSRIQKGDIEISIGRDSNATTDGASSGKLAFDLNNQDRALSPEYSSSAIFGKIQPGVPFQFLATAGLTTYPLLIGELDTLEVEPNSVARTFHGEVLDAWGRPGAEKLSTPLYTGLRTGDAIGVILDAIGWTGPRDIDAGATVMPYWWAEDTDAATAVADLVRAEGPPAIAYVQGGTFVFRDRHHRIFRAASTTTQGLFTHIIPAGSGPGSDYKIERNTFEYQHGFDAIANSVSFDTPVRTGDPYVTEVYSSDDLITLSSGDVLNINASGSDPFFNATPNVITQSGTVTSSLNRTSGAAVVLTLTAVTTAIVSHVGIMATSVSTKRTTQIKAEAPGVTGTTRANWTGESPPFVNIYDAQAIANRIVAVYASNRPRITFTIACDYSNATYMAKLLSLKISDRVTVRNDAMGLNTDFMIERLTYRITNLRIVRVTIGAQIADPIQPANLFQFDVAGHGFDQGKFALTGIDSAATAFRFDTAGQGFDQGVFAT